MIVEVAIRPKDRYRPPTTSEFLPFLSHLKLHQRSEGDGYLYFRGIPTRVVQVRPDSRPLKDAQDGEWVDGEVRKAVIVLEVDGPRVPEEPEGDLFALGLGPKSFVNYLTLLGDMSNFDLVFEAPKMATDEYLAHAEELLGGTPREYRRFLDNNGIQTYFSL